MNKSSLKFISFKYLIKVAENSFQRSILNGSAFCGGPCFYTYCMCVSWKFIRDKFSGSLNAATIKDRHFYNKTADIFNLFKTLKQTFISFAKCLLLDDLYDYDLDLQSGHLFSTSSDSISCICGFIRREQANTMINLFEEINFDQIDFSLVLSHRINVRQEAESNVDLVDCCESKLNCFKLAREITASILQVGVFIHD